MRDDRPDEAKTVIKEEFLQLITKNVWHGVHTKNLTYEQKCRILRSSMFLKDKYLSS